MTKIIVQQFGIKYCVCNLVARQMYTIKFGLTFVHSSSPTSFAADSGTLTCSDAE
jgi:hypothetical protein